MRPSRNNVTGEQVQRLRVSQHRAAGRQDGCTRRLGGEPGLKGRRRSPDAGGQLGFSLRALRQSRALVISTLGNDLSGPRTEAPESERPTESKLLNLCRSLEKVGRYFPPCRAADGAESKADPALGAGSGEGRTGKEAAGLGIPQV